MGFAVLIALGTALLALPVMSADGDTAGLVTSLFTATSAVCVTGLIVVDTATAWSGPGQIVIAGLIQLGGLGIMLLATVVVSALPRRLSLGARLAAQEHAGAPTLGDLRRVVRSVVVLTVAVEGIVAVILAARLWVGYDASFTTGLGHGVFHAISAFNNAGFALYSDNLMRFQTDWVVSISIAAAVIAGGLGWAVAADLFAVGRGRRGGRGRSRRGLARAWSLHTKLTLVTTIVLLVGGFVVVLAFEWANDETLGALTVPHKALAAFFQAVMPRTAGFNTVDISVLHEPTRLVMTGLMFVGGGSASTAGGVKVTTLAVLALVIWAQIRGDQDVNVSNRRIPTRTQREAFVVWTLALGLAFFGALLLVGFSPFPLEDTLFESFSAVGTVGLSTGITGALNTAGQLVLIALMYLGRVGPVALAAALVARRRAIDYRLPIESPQVG